MLVRTPEGTVHLEITPKILDRLIETAESNIAKTKAMPGRIWFNRTDRVREMEQTAQALKEFRQAMEDRERFRCALDRITCQPKSYGADMLQIATEALKG